MRFSFKILFSTPMFKKTYLGTFLNQENVLGHRRQEVGVSKVPKLLFWQFRDHFNHEIQNPHPHIHKEKMVILSTLQIDLLLIKNSTFQNIIFQHFQLSRNFVLRLYSYFILQRIEIKNLCLSKPLYQINAVFLFLKTFQSF